MTFHADDIAIVTGASRGIGHAIADELARQGATVIGTATTEAGAESITHALAQAGYRGHGVRLDVTEADTIEPLIKSLTQQVGPIRILVNNAGITRDNLLLRMSEEEWMQVIQTNLSAVFRLSKAVLRPMIKARYGRIITVTSVIGAIGNAGQANYAAAKAGLVGFTKSLAREVGSRHITANTVAPGFIDTDMTRALPEAQRTALLQQIPLGRFGEVRDVAHAVAFLASSQAAYITGETLHINGGLYMN